MKLNSMVDMWLSLFVIATDSNGGLSISDDILMVISLKVSREMSARQCHVHHVDNCDILLCYHWFLITDGACVFAKPDISYCRISVTVTRHRDLWTAYYKFIRIACHLFI